MANISVFNSLTKTSDQFKIDGNIIKWYTCGPTVYDSSHLGHARTFLTFDIIRRIFEYFGYQVFYVMNITDIDDKIIDRVSKLDGLTDENYNEKFKQFVSSMENEFWQDMDSLNIKRPMVITRVTEYIDKMIKYIEKLEDDGFAYCSNGSVYFDVDEYEKRGFNKEPLRNINNEDAEFNPNSSNVFKDDKKNPYDFALWKKSKPGELKFESRWGLGRIGWHLECSVMSSDVLGKHIDIHSGGIDLIYPHHQCEIMQSNAYENNQDYQWIKYFLHSGHLNIHGEKMSKSLKNFTTIKYYLENIGTSQELRMLFLMHKWDKPLDYSKDTIDEAKRVNKRIQDLVDHLQFIMNEDKPETIFSDVDNEFFQLIDILKRYIDSLLCDNFNTPMVMKTILDGIPRVYKYLEKSRNVQFIKLYFDTLIKITNIFGLEYVSHTQDKDDNNKIKVIELAVNLQEDIRKLVLDNEVKFDKQVLENIFNILNDFKDNKLSEASLLLQDRFGNTNNKIIELAINLREDVRKLVLENKTKIDKQVFGNIFKVLDDFRDNKLPEAGILLQDRAGDTTKYIISSQ